MNWFTHILHLLDPISDKKLEQFSSVMGSVSVGLTITIFKVNWEQVVQAWITTGGSAVIAGTIGFILSPLLKKAFKNSRWLNGSK